MWVDLQVHRFFPCVPSSSGFGIWISLCSKSLDDHVPASGGGTEGLSFKASSAFYTSKFGPPPYPPPFFGVKEAKQLRVIKIEMNIC